MAESSGRREILGPLADFDEWESAHIAREEAGDANATAVAGRKDPSEFRDYRAEVRPGVREFYRLNHTNQTLEFVLAKKDQYLARTRRKMGIWEAMEFL